MTQPTPKVRVEPAMSSWSLGKESQQNHSMLIERINARAKRLGTASLDLSARLIATGHQAQLWHPGILVKDIAMDLAAQRFSAQRLHLVVDQDANEAWQLEVPSLDGDELRVKAVHLAVQTPGVPTGFQSPAEVNQLQERLAGLDSSLTGVLAEALENLPDCESLAEQITLVLARLKKPYAGDVPVMMVSDLAGLDVFESVVLRMLNDAQACASSYNRAVAEYPQAGLTAMVVGRELIELPLWAVGWNEPRRRVFVDLTDSDPMLVYDDGEPIDRSLITLLPRALLLTAVMRGYLCDLFIHGIGGLIYDRVTEAWWSQWAREKLAPMVGVTADVYLDLGAPVVDRAAMDRAVWHKRNLPHNLDRALDLKSEDVKRKHELLEHMQDDRDRARKRSAFHELHQINSALVDRYPEALALADRDLSLAQAGVKNARIAARRDWCFALYPSHALDSLRSQLTDLLDA